MRSFVINMWEALANLRKFSTYYITLVAVFSGFLLVGTVLIWLLYPYKTMSVHKFEVPYEWVMPGEELTYVVDYEKFIDHPETTTLTYVCETSRINSRVEGTRSWVAEGVNTIQSKLPVPNRIKPEVCHLEGITKFKLNPIRETQIQYYSNDFYIGTPSATLEQE